MNVPLPLRSCIAEDRGEPSAVDMLRAAAAAPDAALVPVRAPHTQPHGSAAPPGSRWFASTTGLGFGLVLRLTKLTRDQTWSAFLLVAI